MAAPLPPDEEQRLAELRAYNILDTLPEDAFDDLTLLASEICGSPIALISLVDEDRQWFKSAVGLDETETPRDVAFCAHAILDPTSLFVVSDAANDPRFSKNPLVTTAPGIRFYAGAPLVTPNGRALGALCVIDRIPRDLSPRQVKALEALARQVVAQLELRRTVRELEAGMEDLRQYETLLETYQRSLEASFAAAAAESITDSLTSLKNRRAFQAKLETEYVRSERYGGDLALALLDIDHFKSFNDAFGHPAGDEVLRTVARLLEAGARTTDMVARYGGEEFVVLFPNTSIDAAQVIAERFRKAMDTHPWDHRDVTVSIGIAGWSRDLNGPEDLIGQADRAMYQAKQAGRNRVIAATAIDDGRARLSRITLMPPVEDTGSGSTPDSAEPDPSTRQTEISFVIDDTTSRRREASDADNRVEAEAEV